MIPQTVCFDETPEPQPQGDFEYYVVGPRTSVEQANAIRAAGSKLIIKVQPVRWFIDGQPYLNASWDRVLSRLPYLDFPTLAEPGEGMDGTKLLDFRASLTQNLSQTLIELCHQRGAIGVLFDYGSYDIQGTPSGWADGYATYRRKVATALRVWHATNKVQGYGDLMFEGIQPYGTDYGYPPNYRQIRETPGKPMYLIQTGDLKHRRIICGIALERGALVNYRPTFFSDRWHNEVPPELVL